MNNERIKDIALANGFKLKEQPNGEIDLNPYVYEFAKKLVAQVWREYEPYAAKDEQTIAALQNRVYEQANEILRLKTNVSNAIDCLSEAQDD